MKRALLLLGLFCAACGRTRVEEAEPVSVAVQEPAGTPSSSSEEWQGVPFDSQQWKGADERKRFDMLPDLMANHLRRGMKGAELEALVGPLKEGWSDATSDSYVFWVERPTEVKAHLEFPTRDGLLPLELRTVRGLRLVLERDLLERWELLSQ